MTNQVKNYWWEAQADLVFIIAWTKEGNFRQVNHLTSQIESEHSVEVQQLEGSLRGHREGGDGLEALGAVEVSGLQQVVKNTGLSQLFNAVRRREVTAGGRKGEGLVL